MFSHTTDFLDFLFSFFINVQISQSDCCNIDYPKMPKIAKRASLLKILKP